MAPREMDLMMLRGVGDVEVHGFESNGQPADLVDTIGKDRDTLGLGNRGTTGNVRREQGTIAKENSIEGG
jgi:hypothetical protein